jgi:hypothetical protein
VWRYLSGMFNRRTDWERRYRLTAKRRGRTRFIWRDKVLENLVTWFVVTLGLTLFIDRRPFSVRDVFIYLIKLPIWLLSGYLNGVWRWKELDKKYRELPS